ncbi:methylaspartate mutase subunit S [Actinophytocola sp.]|uniref:methylaspartate mutase subunit S n=1 Tax=Actinophytocola sp. TaxID=1872138 RepID=UPI003D6ADF0C
MAASAPTVLTGTIGDDVHVIGIRIIEYALRKAGYDVVPLGVLVSQEQFVAAALETDAAAMFVSSLNGHAEISLRGFREACVEAGLADILIYVGGQLTIRRPPWDEVRRLFEDELGVDRVYPPDMDPGDAVRELSADLARVRGRS